MRRQKIENPYGARAPSMAAGVTDQLWEIKDVISLMDKV